VFVCIANIRDSYRCVTTVMNECSCAMSVQNFKRVEYEESSRVFGKWSF